MRRHITVLASLNTTPVQEMQMKSHVMHLIWYKIGTCISHVLPPPMRADATQQASLNEKCVSTLRACDEINLKANSSCNVYSILVTSSSYHQLVTIESTCFSERLKSQHSKYLPGIVKSVTRNKFKLIRLHPTTFHCFSLFSYLSRFYSKYSKETIW